MVIKDEDIISLLIENLPAGDITIDDCDRPFQEYGLDSLDIMALLLAVEKKYQLMISDADVGKLTTPNDVLAYVHKCKAD